MPRDMIGPDQFFTDRSKQLAGLTIQRAMPAIYHYRGFAAAGGLMSYGVDLADAYRLEGVYVVRVLKGEKPDPPPQTASTNANGLTRCAASLIFGHRASMK